MKRVSEFMAWSIFLCVMVFLLLFTRSEQATVTYCPELSNELDRALVS